MNDNQHHLEQIEHLVKTLSALIRVLIDILPEGGDKDFDEDAFYTILDKANSDLSELSTAIARCCKTAGLTSAKE